VHPLMIVIVLRLYT